MGGLRGQLCAEHWPDPWRPWALVEARLCALIAGDAVLLSKIFFTPLRIARC